MVMRQQCGGLDKQVTDSYITTEIVMLIFNRDSGMFVVKGGGVVECRGCMRNGAGCVLS